MRRTEAMMVTHDGGVAVIEAWPTVDLVIVRENCTEERYVLPTRGGPVRGCA